MDDILKAFFHAVREAADNALEKMEKVNDEKQVDEPKKARGRKPKQEPKEEDDYSDMGFGLDDGGDTDSDNADDETPVYSEEDISNALRSLVKKSADKSAAIALAKKIFSKYKIKNVTELDESDYNDFMNDVVEAQKGKALAKKKSK